MTMPQPRLQLNSVRLQGTDRALAIDIAPDGSHVAIARSGLDGEPKALLFRSDGSNVAQWAHDASVGHGVCFATGPDDTPVVYVALRTDAGMVVTRRDLDASKSKLFASYPGAARVSSLVPSSDGSMVAACGTFLEVWDSRAESLIASIAPRDNVSLRVAFMPDGRSIILAGHVDDLVVELALPNLNEIRRWPAPGRSNRQVIISPDAEFLLIVREAQMGAFLYRLSDNQRAFATSFHSNTAVGHYAFASPSLLLYVIGAGPSAYDLSGKGYIPGPDVGGHRQVAFVVSPRTQRLAIAWADSDALIGTFAIAG